VYARDLHKALTVLYPRSAMLLVQSGDAIVYVTPLRGELCATDAGATFRELGHAFDDDAAQAICGENCTEWCSGEPGSWIVRSIDAANSLTDAVSDVETARRALLTAAQYSVTSGDDEADAITRVHQEPDRMKRNSRNVRKVDPALPNSHWCSYDTR